MSYNIADLFEHVADSVPERPALIDGDLTLTFAELDRRSNRIAHYLGSQGIGTGDHVGIYAQNSHEWIEAMYGCFKIRAIPINVNFRYVKDELAYIFDNADLAACVFDRQYAPLIAEIRDQAPLLKVLVHIDDGTSGDLAGLDSIAYDDACATAPEERGFDERSPDDHYVLYTGGTTGMPKGVIWRQEDVFFALGQGIDAMTGNRVQNEFEMAEKAAVNGPITFLVIPPLMHGAAQWGSMGQMFQGNTIVLLPRFSAEAAWRLVESAKVNSLLITGDAMGRPMIEHLEAHPDAYDTSTLLSVSSSAAIFSPTVKDRFLERFPNLIITDSIGSSESGFNGIRMVGKGQAQNPNGGPTVTPGPDVVILDADLRPLPRDSRESGKLGRGGNIPLGYYRDEEKTAATFITAADGRRYAVSGDWARWEDDDLITLLGRGSTTINSGGEKIHPEEVEQALKDHPAVFDCIVVGVPDERWGQTVAAVVQCREGATVELEDLNEHARRFIAGYKVPRELHIVDEVVRSPSGKPDYPWATALARGGTVSTLTSFEVMGQTVTMPVEVRAARQAASTFLVDATAAQRIVGSSGLTVARKPGNRAICSIAIVDYEDNDLGAYKEIALAFIVEEHPDLVADGSRAITTLIHRLPVSEQFTCEAGRGIWGFPKWVTDIDMEFGERDAHATLREDGMDVLTVRMRRGRLSVPKKPMNMVAYSLDSEGVVRRTPWETSGSGRQQIRPGGCAVEVGYGHPFADELRTLGFPRPAMLTVFDDALAATFEAPRIV